MARYVKIREENGGNGSEGRTRWVPVEEIVEPGAPGLLQSDPDPTLGADLKLNNHGIVGELEDQTLVIDGGLL